MKIAIDIDKLLAEGRIDQDEYTRLKSLATEDTSSLAFNILISFGVITVVLGVMLLLPSYETALALGIVLSGYGIYLQNKYAKNWGVLGTISLLVGILMASGGILVMSESAVIGSLLVMIICAVGGILTKRTLLIIIATLALSETVEAIVMGGAGHLLMISNPLITVIFFGALSRGAYFFSHRLSADYSHLTIAVYRTSLLLLNSGFWVGSLWGDDLGLRNPYNWNFVNPDVIPNWFFAWAWAITLIGMTIWAARQNRRWEVNFLSVCGAIHFYTQYLLILRASPITLTIAGIIALGIAVALARYNRATL